MDIDQWPGQDLLEYSLDAMRWIVGSLVVGNAILKSLAEGLHMRKGEERERDGEGNNGGINAYGTVKGKSLLADSQQRKSTYSISSMQH